MVSATLATAAQINNGSTIKIFNQDFVRYSQYCSAGSRGIKDRRAEEITLSENRRNKGGDLLTPQGIEIK